MVQLALLFFFIRYYFVIKWEEPSNYYIEMKIFLLKWASVHTLYIGGYTISSE